MSKAVGDKQIAAVVNDDAVWFFQLALALALCAEGRDEAAVGRKLLNACVVIIGDVDRALCVNCKPARILKLAGAHAVAAFFEDIDAHSFGRFISSVLRRCYGLRRGNIFRDLIYLHIAAKFRRVVFEGKREILCKKIFVGVLDILPNLSDLIVYGDVVDVVLF